MWYPEESVTYCRHCDLDIPNECFWRGRGYMITGPGTQARTSVLYSECPECGRRQSVGLEGKLWFRVLYGWLWKLRYPNRRPPEREEFVELPRRRVSGE